MYYSLTPCCLLPSGDVVMVKVFACLKILNTASQFGQHWQEVVPM